MASKQLKNKGLNLRSYSLKLDLNKTLETNLQYLSDLVLETANQLLDLVWSEDYLLKLAVSDLKAYKVINEKHVSLVYQGQVVYFPSRIRRVIAEWVGRTVRSQYNSFQCFNLVREILLVLPLNLPMKDLVKLVSNSIFLRYGLYYKFEAIKKTIRMIRYFWLKKRIDIWALSYFVFVKPRLKNLVLPYGADDNQALKYLFIKKGRSKKISVELKVPRCPYPMQKKDWVWCQKTLTLPSKLSKQLSTAKNEKPKRPDLRFQVLKGGLKCPVLQFAWEFPHIQLDFTLYPKERVLAVDLGLVNLVTSVVCEDGLQISKPYFYKRASSEIVKIERVYQIIRQLQKKIKRLGAHAPGTTRRHKELRRLHVKLRHKRQNECYLLIKHLLTLATHYRCSQIVLEDLRSYQPNTESAKWSRRLNNWLRGSFWTLLKSKVQAYGLKLHRVNPRDTSTYCPRCGKKGFKVRNHRSRVETKFGRTFYCSHCQYRADRDYIAELNIYRKFACLNLKLKNKKHRYLLSSARVISYMKITTVSAVPNFMLGPTRPNSWVGSST